MKLTDIEQKELIRYTSLFDFSEYLRDKTILITGSKGIVGSGVIKWVLWENARKGMNCHIIASTRNKNIIPEYIELDDNIEFCTFGNEIEECKDKKIDYIIHAAAPTSGKVFLSQPVESLGVIVKGTERMLQLAKEHHSRMLYLSSEEVYGTPDLDVPVSEDFVGAVNSLSVRSCYPLGKKVAELLCRSYFEEYGIDVSVIRPTVIIGLWQEYDSVKVESEILRCIVEKKNLVMKSDGSTKKCVIYSLDAISAVFTTLVKGAAGEVYNATNPNTFCSVKERAYNSFARFAPSVTIEFLCEGNVQNLGYLPKRSLCEDVSKISQLGWKAYADIEHIYEVDLKRFAQRRVSE